MESREERGDKSMSAAEGHGDSQTDRSENIVERVLQLYDGSLTKLANELERLTGRKCTKQMVGNWRDRGQIPAAWVVPVYRLTRIPVDDLLERTRGRMPKPASTDTAQVLREHVDAIIADGRGQVDLEIVAELIVRVAERLHQGVR